MTGITSLLIFLVALLPFSYASVQNIMIGNTAVTMIPGPGPIITLVMADLNINDPYQQWSISGEFIISAAPGYTQYAWDVTGSSTATGTRVIGYPKGTANNQKWNIQNGVISSPIAAGFTVLPMSTAGLFMTYAMPATQFNIKNAITLPFQCSSVGDPHISPYPGGRMDIYNPGSQQPGTYTLSKTGNKADPDYTLVQADQQLCRAHVPGVYCNRRVILNTRGQVVQVNGDVVTINGVNVTVTGTFVVGNGVNVTKIAKGNYVINYPTGNTKVIQRNSNNGYPYVDITTTALRGTRQPTGGVCAQFVGPNLEPSLPTTPNNFLISWRAPNRSEDLFTYTSEFTWRVANPLTFTSITVTCVTNNPSLDALALTLCSPLNSNSPFASQCAPFISNTADVYQACLLDVMCLGDESFAASNMDAFATKCCANAGSACDTMVFPTSGINTIAMGPGLSSSIPQSPFQTFFDITAKDVQGNTVTTGTDIFVVIISGGIPFTQVYVGGGVYRISYSPEVAGPLSISVLHQGVTHVRDSPFDVTVVASPESMKFNILFGDLAATLVPGTLSLVAVPLEINNPFQQWTISSGRITSTAPGFTSIVWGVTGSLTATGTQVICFPVQTGAILPNQIFALPSNPGPIVSALAINYTVIVNAMGSLVMTLNSPPAVATFPKPVTLPWACSSVGDPHIQPYPGGRTDIYNPGSQQPGSYTLSKTGTNGDSDYLVIQADQQLCTANVPGVYCNKRAILKTQGHIVQVEGDVVTVNGAVVTVAGTYTVGNGVSVTRISAGSYILNYPNGNTKVVQRSGSFRYVDITITISGGRRPTGGVCAQFTGPNIAPSQPATPFNFLLSWRAPTRSDDLFTYISDVEWQAANPVSFVSTNTYSTTNAALYTTALSLCSPLKPGSPLATQCSPFIVNAVDVYEACLFDVMNCNETSFAESNIEAFCTKCQEDAGSSGLIIALPTSGFNSIATGPGLAPTISQSPYQIFFDITAKDLRGNTVTTGGDMFTVTLSGGLLNTQMYVGGGVYRVFYTPDVSGPLTISVQLQGTHIRGSPFTVLVTPTAMIFNIMFGDLAATLIPGEGPELALVAVPLRINDPLQQWTISSGFIVSVASGYTNFVWDVRMISTQPGTPVICYTMATTGVEANQKWVLPTKPGPIVSWLASNYTVFANSTGLYMTYMTPAVVVTLIKPITLPWKCASVGDPHIDPYPGGRSDIYNPGSHQPGTYTLSRTGMNGDSDYFLIQADQQLCRSSVPGVYCNKRAILKTQGHVVQVQGNTVTINGLVVTITGTYTVGNGVTVTKTSSLNYLISYPSGNTQIIQRGGAYIYVDIYISVTSGRQPTGGVCTQFIGPNLEPLEPATVYNFLISWRVRNRAEDLFAYSSDLEWLAANPITFVFTNGSIPTANIPLFTAALARCAPLSLSSTLATQCSPFMTTTTISTVYAACIFDIMVMEDLSAAYSSIDCFASRCSANAGNDVPLTLPTSGVNSVASGPGLALSITQSPLVVSFDITAKDVRGNTVTTGDDTFVVTISGAGGISSTQAYLGGGVYRISYAPDTAGTFIISILHQGLTPIKNSPFPVTVVPATNQVFNIFFGNLAATLVPSGITSPITLVPVNIKDPFQLWTFSRGYIFSAAPGYLDYVWDVTGSSTANGTLVIAYPILPASPSLNQRWILRTNPGPITSQLVVNYTATPCAASRICMTYNSPPAMATINPPNNLPWICYSYADPHIKPFPGGREDIYMPGAQQPGTYTLVKTGSPSDPDYLLVQGDQQLCRANVPGVYCNRRGIIKTQGHVIQVNGNVVTVNGEVVTVTGTYTVGNGVTITKVANGNYIVNYPNGKTQFHQRSNGAFSMVDITVTLTGGRTPTGGVCSQFVGPNIPAPPAAPSPYNFIFSWRAPTRSDDLFTWTSDTAWRAANPLTFTSNNGTFSITNQTLYASALAACALISATSSLTTQCAAHVPATLASDVYSACVMDVMLTQELLFAASNVDMFASCCTENAASSNVSIVLPTSPASCTVAGLGVAPLIDQSSVAVSFNITARDVKGNVVTTGGEVFVVTLSGGRTSTQTYLGGGVYRVSYTPNVLGTFTISITLGGVAIMNSPLTITIVTAATDASKTTVAGQGILPLPSMIPTGEDVTFVVTARSGSGAQKSTGGDRVIVLISGGFYTLPRVKDNNDGTYLVTYQHNSANFAFQVIVSINGVPISGSPFKVYVGGDKK